MIRVLVVEDQALVRTGLVSMLAATEGIEVVGEAADGREGVRLARDFQPDVVLMDLRLPVMNGIDAIRAIRFDTHLTETRVLVLTTFGLDEYVFGALHEGADGFVLKDTAPERIIDAVRATADGGSLLSAPVLKRLVDETRSWRSAPSEPAPELTAREADILQLVCQGQSNRQIADQLAIGTATVKTYVSRLLMKFEVGSRVALVVRAHDHGLIQPSHPPARIM